MTWEVAQQLAVNREGWRRRDDDDEMMMMPISTNRDVINRDNVTRMILPLVIIFCQNNNRHNWSIRKDIGNWWQKYCSGLTLNFQQQEKIFLSRARSANVQQQTAKTLWYKQFKHKANKTTKELDRHHTTRFEKHRHDLDVAQQLAVNREGCRRRVAQCVFDTGWTKVYV